MDRTLPPSRRRRARHAAAVLACAAFAIGGVRPSAAQDVDTAKRELSSADDFRVRVGAALFLAKAKPSDARPLLEKALGDPHPAVRTAAAAALGRLHDAAAIPSLQSHLASEGSAGVRSQLQRTIDALGGGGGSSGSARYAVQLGSIKNLTGVRGSELGVVLRSKVRERAASIPGAQVIEGSASGSKVPVLMLDVNLTRLSQESQPNGSVSVSARVEVSVRKIPENTLKASLSGAATSMGTAGSASHLAVLQDQAVEGAVESAMRAADRGLSLAARN